MNSKALIEGALLASRRPYYGARGSEHRNAKLTEDKVREMRRRYDGGKGETYGELARAFGIARKTARSIVRRESWRHVP